MLIDRDYLLKKSLGPSAPKLFFDQQVIPAAVNLAGGVEVALDRTAVRLGVRPAVLVAGLAGLLSWVAIRALRPGRT